MSADSYQTPEQPARRFRRLMAASDDQSEDELSRLAAGQENELPAAPIQPGEADSPVGSGAQSYQASDQESLTEASLPAWGFAQPDPAASVETPDAHSRERADASQAEAAAAPAQADEAQDEDVLAEAPPADDSRLEDAAEPAPADESRMEQATAEAAPASRTELPPWEMPTHAQAAGPDADITRVSPPRADEDAASRDAAPLPGERQPPPRRPIRRPPSPGADAPGNAGLDPLAETVPDEEDTAPVRVQPANPAPSKIGGKSEIPTQPRGKLPPGAIETGRSPASHAGASERKTSAGAHSPTSPSRPGERKSSAETHGPSEALPPMARPRPLPPRLAGRSCVAEKPLSPPAGGEEATQARPAVGPSPARYPSQASGSQTGGYTGQTGATYAQPGGYTPGQTGPMTGMPPATVTQSVPGKKARQKKTARGSGWGCFLRSLIGLIFAVVLVALCAISLLFVEYYRIAATLPDISDLRQRASQFETTRILDRNGNTLYEILDPTAGRRTYVKLDAISPYMIAATVATEDSGFYSHPGVDLPAIARAFWQNYQAGGIASGASTITQQLARNLLFTPEERVEQTYQRKIREAILATEITRRYTKDEILELYLNENNYGNLAYGVEAAAQTYFNTNAASLTLGQAAFLAGLPQAPATYDIHTNPEATLQRMEDVLVLMYEASIEQGCIFVSNSPQRVCLDPVMITSAANEIKAYSFQSSDVEIRYPHWVNFIRAELEKRFDAQTIYRSGFTVYTTLDPDLQDLAQQMVSDQVASLAANNASDGALVAIRPSTGEVLAMVGSADFYNEAISGQVNMATSPTRQPGSAMKPFTYTAAFERGWTPSTLIWDVESEFPPSGREDDNRPPYEPVNYDGRFHGPVTVRTALANSYNIPAVKTLDFIGIYDDPELEGEDGFLAFARRLGLTTLTREDYGLSLTLGGGEVSLFELTGAYAIYANGGRRVPPVAITRILDHEGNVVFEHSQPVGEQVVRAEHAYLISSILSDNDARTPAFGANSVLNLPFPAAAKTGTTNDFRDNWTLGYTPDLAVGVWVGNADYTPMQNTSGLTGAAPLWSAFMQAAVPKINPNPGAFSRPGGIVETIVCDFSGTLPSEWCPLQRRELFAADQPPLPKEDDLWRRVVVDTWTALEASDECRGFEDEVFALNVSEPAARRWINRSEEGQAWAEKIGFERPVTFAPDRECRADDPRPILAITAPREWETITNTPLEIRGQADATNWFDYYRLEFGMGEDPVEWRTLDERRGPVRDVQDLYEWRLENLPAGPVTLRLYMHSVNDTFAEVRLPINLQVPTPTPTPTATFTPTATWTPTSTATQTPPPTSTSTPTPTWTPTPPATETPTPTEFFPKATDPVVTLPPEITPTP